MLANDDGDFRIVNNAVGCGADDYAVRGSYGWRWRRLNCLATPAAAAGGKEGGCEQAEPQWHVRAHSCAWRCEERPLAIREPGYEDTREEQAACGSHPIEWTSRPNRSCRDSRVDGQHGRRCAGEADGRRIYAACDVAR